MQGAEDKRIEKIAIMMLEDNMPMELIKKYTNLSAVRIYQIALLESGAISTKHLDITLPPDSLFTLEDIWRRSYEQRQKAIMDYNSAMSASRKIGYELGRKKLVCSMLKDKVSIETISKVTDLTIEQIKEISQNDSSTTA